MLIDLSWLKLHPKEEEKFHLEQDPSTINVDASQFRLVDRVIVDITIGNTGRLMVGFGTIKTVLEFACDRCLSKFRRPFNIPFDVEFCEEINRDYFKNEENFIYFTEPVVDLEHVVLESIFLNLPLRTLCSPDCKGLCPVCGCDLNQRQCECRKEDTDPRWDVLAKLMKGKEVEYGSTEKEAVQDPEKHETVPVEKDG
ncbi:MAG: YceD family protein [Chitinophagales bacterium]